MMKSIMFGNQIVMVMHICTISHDPTARTFQISLSNGLVLSESYTSTEQQVAIMKMLAFDGSEVPSAGVAK
jgi:hypothetical protein